MMHYKYEVFTCKNSKAQDKPNEDLTIYDEKERVGLLLDGVSRDRENGVYPFPSPALVASQVFADSILEQASCVAENGILKIQNMICQANTEIERYNARLQHRFPAGTVGIVFSFEHGYLNYGYIGDCYAAIIRDDCYRVFTECQTMMVSKNKKEYSSDEIRFDICNHINHPCGYGVWDGNSSSMDFVKYGTIKIMSGDTIFMYTDGLQTEVLEKSMTELVKSPMEQLFEATPLDGRDDRTCIRITIQ